MKGLLANTLIGLALGRFGSVWLILALVPIVAAELTYGVWAFRLGLGAGIRRGLALLACGELAFVLGALMRPIRDET